MPETSQERTEQATDRRKTDARKKGTVAKSVDLTKAVVTVVLLMVLPGAISSLSAGFLQGMRDGLTRLPSDTSPTNLGRSFFACLGPTLPGLGMIVAATLGAGLVANFAQVGLMFSPEALVPNLSKINPFEGAKRLFSSRSTFETIKATLKMGLFGFVAYSAIAGRWVEIRNFSYITPLGAMQLTAGILRDMTLRIAIVWGVLAGADYYFQRKQIQKSLMMSKQEVKQEHKESDGSPQTKMARMIRRRKMRRMRMKQAVESADVVITNPTHYAIAIKYDVMKGQAPIVVAKGADILAAKIRETAKQARIPIVPNPPLARQLYKQCEVGDFVPRELFQAVAEVLAYVYKTLGKMKPGA